METIRGKTSRDIGFDEWKKRISGYREILLDLGTGDGRYVSTVAGREPNRFVIGVDSCRENLREYSRREQPNALFVIAEAHRLPHELNGLASRITINFPWGSLLEGLLHPGSALMDGLLLAAGPSAALTVRLNAGALAEVGAALDAGAEQVYDSLSRSGWLLDAPRPIGAADLRTFPSTWSRRLAHGRDARAVELSGRLAG